MCSSPKCLNIMTTLNPQSVSGPENDTLKAWHSSAAEAQQAWTFKLSEWEAIWEPCISYTNQLGGSAGYNQRMTLIPPNSTWSYPVFTAHIKAPLPVISTSLLAILIALHNLFSLNLVLRVHVLRCTFMNCHKVETLLHFSLAWLTEQQLCSQLTNYTGNIEAIKEKTTHLRDSVAKVIVFPEEAQKFLWGTVYCQLVGL